MSFVLDASATLPWFFRDEATPFTSELQERAFAGETIHVPAHWPVEILNASTRAARRGRLDSREVDQFLGVLATMEIVVDAVPFLGLWQEARPLIRAYRLSGYDAAYLALAKRLGLKLATLDGQLQAAALAEGLLWSG